MAEALMRAGLTKRNCNTVDVASAGTWAEWGSPASSGAIDTLRDRAVDLRRHRSRPLDPVEVARADLVVAMTSVHVKEILEIIPDARHKVLMIKAIPEMQPERMDGADAQRRLQRLLRTPRPKYRRSLDLDDPLGLPRSAYERCVNDLLRGINALLAVICPSVPAPEPSRKGATTA
ncbi:MAG: hypothetical protein M3280_03595 [Actinomycetota bacterium]|nr:hypothetical protein [Actinomycetota bacterium]